MGNIGLLTAGSHLPDSDTDICTAVIQHISCAGRPADYSYNDHLSSLSLSDPKDVHLYPELKRKLYAAASEGSGGELSILLPPDINVELQGAGGTSAADHARSGSAVSDAPTPGGSAIDYAPITIKIEYLVRDPVDGLQFVRPTAEAPYRVPHLYTSPTCADAARCWVPCVDSLWERCTWELEFVVPKHLSAEEEDEDVVEGETSLEGGMEDSEVIVVCSGDLMEQVSASASFRVKVPASHSSALPLQVLDFLPLS